MDFILVGRVQSLSPLHCLLFTVSNCAARVRRGCGAGLSCPSHWTRAPRPRGSRLGLCSGQTTFDPYTSLSVLRSRPPFGGSGSSSPHFGGSGYCYKSNKFWGKKYNNNKKLYYLYYFQKGSLIIKFLVK